MVEIIEFIYGLVFILNLIGLVEGLYGFYIYENLSCELKEKDGKFIVGLVVGGYWNLIKVKGYGFLWFDDVYLGDFLVLIVLYDGIVI